MYKKHISAPSHNPKYEPKPITNKDQLRLDEEYAASLMYEEPKVEDPLDAPPTNSYKVEQLVPDYDYRPKNRIDHSSNNRNPKYAREIQDPKKKEDPCKKWDDLRKEVDQSYKRYENICKKPPEKIEYQHKKWDELYKKSEDVYKKYEDPYKKSSDLYKKRENPSSKMREPYKKAFEDPYSIPHKEKITKNPKVEIGRAHV